MGGSTFNRARTCISCLLPVLTWLVFVQFRSVVPCNVKNLKIELTIGRIGRIVLRNALQYDNIDVVAINESVLAPSLCRLSPIYQQPFP